MIPSGRPREFDRAQVLEVAMRLFWEKGFEGTSKRELMEATGIASQSLYNAFGDKRRLFLSALMHYVDARMDMLRSVLEGEGSPIERLRAYVGLWEGVAGEEGSEHGCMMCNTLAEFGDTDDEIRALLTSKMGESRAMIAGVLREAREAGQVSSDLDPEATAAMLVSTTFGVSLLHRMGASRDVVRQVAAGALASLR